MIYCEKCGGGLHKHKKRTNENGKESIQYKCPECNTYITYYEKQKFEKIHECPTKGPKILLLDIETAPLMAYIWRLWKQVINLGSMTEDWFILTWAARWLGTDDVYTDALPNYKKEYKEDSKSDKKVLETIWEFLDKADIVIAHNGNKFDLPKLNARFIKNGIEPPSPYRTIDTCLVAKQIFSFTSNKLDYLGQFLGVGKKLEHEGLEMWIGCLNGDQKCWDKMLDYNVQDIILLEDVYLKMRPWIKNHPNMGLYIEGDIPVCVACGSDAIIKDGFAYTYIGKFQRFKCKNCGKYMRGRLSILNKYKKKALKANSL